MSRTYKDSPYLNPKTKYGRKRADITVDHEHHNLGRTITYGGRHTRTVFESKTRTREVETLTHIFPKDIKEGMEVEVRPNSHGTPLHFIVEKTTKTVTERYMGEFVVKEYNTPIRTVEYAEHCTIDETPTIYGWRQYYRVMYSPDKRPTCSTSIHPHYYKRNRPRKFERNNYHRTHRNDARTRDNIITKLYNSGENLEEYDWDNPNYPTHNGWWD